MPYLNEERKRAIDQGYPLEKPGDLAYSVTMVMLDGNPATTQARVAVAVGRYLSGRAPSFARYAEVLGAVSAALFEYLRRKQGKDEVSRAVEKYIALFYTATVAPHEDKKIIENGDVY